MMADDVTEGVDSFINKRQAVWKGRWDMESTNTLNHQWQLK